MNNIISNLVSRSISNKMYWTAVGPTAENAYNYTIYSTFLSSDVFVALCVLIFQCPVSEAVIYLAAVLLYIDLGDSR